MGMCHPNWLVFHQKSLDKSPILVKKILRRVSHYTKIVNKLSNQLVLRQKKPLEMGPDLQKFQKTRHIAIFEGEKFLEWVGVSDLGRHTPSKNNLSTPHLWHQIQFHIS